MPEPTTTTTPTTLLEAVNSILRDARLAPVTTLVTASDRLEVQDALNTVNVAAREVQLRGWDFNTERELVITRSAGPAYEATLPANTLAVRMARYSTDPASRLVWRGGKLYDPVGHTFALTSDPEVTLVVALVFEDLPEAARQLITATAGYRFVPPRLPTGAAFRYTEDALRRAEADMAHHEVDSIDAPLPFTSPHFARFKR